MNVHLLFYDATIWSKLEVFFSYSSQHNMSVQPNVVTVIHIIKSHPISKTISLYLRQILFWDESCSMNQWLSITDSTYIRAWSYHAYRYPISSDQYNSVSNSPHTNISYWLLAVHRSHHTLHFVVFVSLLHTLPCQTQPQ